MLTTIVGAVGESALARASTPADCETYDSRCDSTCLSKNNDRCASAALEFDMCDPSASGRFTNIRLYLRAGNARNKNDFIVFCDKQLRSRESGYPEETYFSKSDVLVRECVLIDIREFGSDPSET